jgi:nucleotide-binding universal stress UspA family protein
VASRQGVPHECFYVRSASVPDGIIKVATDRGCDLICMGSQGRHGVAGLLLGSDTVGVLTNCTIPLLVYR